MIAEKQGNETVYTCPNQKYETVKESSGVHMSENMLNALKELGPNFDLINWIKNSGNSKDGS